MKILTLLCRWGFRFLILCVLGIAGVLITAYLLGAPEISSDPLTVYYDTDNNLINHTTEQQDKITLDDIAPSVIDATIAIEDKHYYEHHGFDFRGIMRAVLKNFTAGDLKEGASTISQQYARNLYLSHEKTWLRKIKEAFYTIRLEMFYSKDTIMEGYLNTIYYGHGAYGIEEASELFFNKKAKDLEVAEAAMLAGIPKGPTYYSPFNDKEKAINRQQLILKQMLQQGIIDQATYYEAKAVDLELANPEEKEAVFAHYFKDTALQEAAKILDIDADTLRTSGYRIYTTLDATLQEKTEKAVQTHVPEDSDIQASAITITPENGAIKSLVGGTDYQQSSFNRATDAKRLVGSAFKPLLYYAALEHGYTASTMLLSEPTSFAMADGNVYHPKNFNGYYAYKPISLAQAIALSDNIYAVKTNLFIDPKRVAKTAKRFGIQSDLPSVPSLALGSATLSLLEMTHAYGTIASGGKNVDTHTITKIQNQYGKTIYHYDPPQKKQVLNEQKAFLLTHLMTGMFDRRLNGYMEVTGSSIIDDLTHLYAGKSGTTNADNWMIGFSPKVVTGVWTGYDNNQPIEKAKEKPIAKQIWAETIEAAHQGVEDTDFAIPDGIVKRMVDPETGQLASENCPIRRTTYFEKGTEPTETCTKHNDKQQKNKPPENKSFWRKLMDIF